MGGKGAFQSAFLEGSISASLLGYIAPVAISLMTQALYSLTDLWVVGRYAGSASIAAVASGGQVIALLTSVITGLATGATVRIANVIGQGKPVIAENIAAAEIRLMTAVTALITLVMFFGAAGISRAMNAPPEALGAMTAYIRICGGGMLFVSAFNVISGFYRSIGNSRITLAFVLASSLVNLLGDLILVGAFHQGAAGAAAATVFSQFVSLGLSIISLRKGRLPFKVKAFSGRSSRGEILNIARVGFPIVINDLLTGISILIVISIINDLGLAAAASVGIAEKLFIFLVLVPTAFLQGLAAFVAQNAGAGQLGRANQSLGVSLQISLACGVLMFLLTCFMGGELAGCFEKDPVIIDSARAYLKAGAFEYLFLSVTYCLQGYLSGIGKTRLIMLIGFISAFGVRIPLTYLVSRLPDADMFQMGLVVSASAGVNLVLHLAYYIVKYGKRRLALWRKLY